MATEDAASDLVFYPAYCFKVSPTHFTWVKMTVADVHRLKPRPGFEGQNIYFYHNHPIQFICLAGIIVARDEYPLRTILTLDDSSGSTIEIVVSKPKSGENTSGISAAAITKATDSRSENQKSLSHVTATAREPLSITPLVTGAVVKIKGKISTFRSTYQLLLERFDVLPDTNAEVRFWDERSRFIANILSIPWSLRADEVAQLRRENAKEEQQLLRQQKRAAEKQRRALQREEKAQAIIQKRWENYEKTCEREAALCREANRKAQEKLRLKINNKSVI